MKPWLVGLWFVAKQRKNSKKTKKKKKKWFLEFEGETKRFTDLNQARQLQCWIDEDVNFVYTSPHSTARLND